MEGGILIRQYALVDIAGFQILVELTDIALGTLTRDTIANEHFHRALPPNIIVLKTPR
jgi:hypothetical protein